MFDALLELIVPRGAYVAIGVAVGAAFSKQLRPVAKQLLKAGMTAAEQAQVLAAEAYERGQDLVAEARYEQAQETRAASNNHGASNGRSGRTTRRSPRRSTTRATSSATE